LSGDKLYTDTPSTLPLTSQYTTQPTQWHDPTTEEAAEETDATAVAVAAEAEEVATDVPEEEEPYPPTTTLVHKCPVDEEVAAVAKHPHTSADREVKPAEDEDVSREKVDAVGGVMPEGVDGAAAVGVEADEVDEEPRRKRRNLPLPKNWMLPWMNIGLNLVIRSWRRRSWMMTWMLTGVRRRRAVTRLPLSLL
jgi:hypothetical protein